MNTSVPSDLSASTDGVYPHRADCGTSWAVFARAFRVVFAWSIAVLLWLAACVFVCAAIAAVLEK